MKLIQVPDVNDVIDLAVFKESIQEINKFNASLNDFGKKILEDKFLFSSEGLQQFLSAKDYKNLKIDERAYGRYAFDYKSKQVVDFDIERMGWTMGASTGKECSYSFSDSGEILIVQQNWSTKEARFNHVPWIPRSKNWYFNYAEGTILDKNEYLLFEMERKAKKNNEFCELPQDMSHIEQKPISKLETAKRNAKFNKAISSVRQPAKSIAQDLQPVEAMDVEMNPLMQDVLDKSFDNRCIR